MPSAIARLVSRLPDPEPAEEPAPVEVRESALARAVERAKPARLRRAEDKLREARAARAAHQDQFTALNTAILGLDLFSQADMNRREALLAERDELARQGSALDAAIAERRAEIAAIREDWAADFHATVRPFLSSQVGPIAEAAGLLRKAHAVLSEAEDLAIAHGTSIRIALGRNGRKAALGDLQRLAASLDRGR